MIYCLSLQDGRCSWDGGSEGIPALDSAVALLRLRHRSIFGEETLAEAEDVVGRMGEGALPTVDVELVPPPPAHNISRESVEAPPVRPVPSSIDANQQTRG